MLIPYVLMCNFWRFLSKNPNRSENYDTDFIGNCKTISAETLDNTYALLICCNIVSIIGYDNILVFSLTIVKL
jgi:hypothetical protein